MAATTEPTAPPSGDGGSETQQGSAAADQASKDRTYGVFTELELDMTANDSTIAQSLKTAVGVDPEGKPLPQAVVLVRVGRAQESEPRKALAAVGRVRDLSGSYEVIADSQRNKYPNVSSKIERVVSIG